MTVADVLTDALREIGVLNAVDPASGEDQTLALGKLNRLLDNWNAESRGVYAETIQTFTLVPGTNPHTIGTSTPNWTVTQRPQAITRANLIDANNLRTPIALHDREWWMALTDPTFQDANPRDGYYEPTWPNGSLYLWPTPSAAYSVELQLRVVLAQVVASDTFTLPPGYQDAITLTLAESLTTPFRVPLTPDLARSADRARARIFGNNGRIPRLQTRDAGMPGGSGGRFDWRTGAMR